MEVKGFSKGFDASWENCKERDNDTSGGIKKGCDVS